MIDRIDSLLQTKRLALGIRSARQEMLASNIANADTPHYKARDIDFKLALEGATAGRLPGALDVARTSSRHLSGEGAGQWGDALKYRAEFQSAVDGNTVNMDVERAAFAENAFHIEALLTFIQGNFRTLSTAIQGQS